MRGLSQKVLGVLLCSLFGVHVAHGDFLDYPLTNRELEIEAGYYDRSGKYLGGIPKVGSEYFQRGQCVTPVYGTSPTGTSSSGAYNATNCLLWEERRSVEIDEEGAIVEGDSKDGSEFRVCSCYELTENNNCLQWNCNQVMVDRDTECVDNTEFYNRRLRQVCYTVINISSGRCRCDNETELQFCTIWSCEEYLGNDIVYETNECVEISVSRQHCNAWTAILISSEGASARVCECVAEEFGDGICSMWECKEKRSNSCERCNDMALSVACFGVLGLLGVLQLIKSFHAKEFLSCCVVLRVLWIIAAAGAAIFYGGQTGGMYVGIMWVGVGGLYAFCCRPTKD